MSRYERDKKNRKRWIEEAIRYDPNFGLAYRYLGLWYRSQKKHKLAIIALKKSVDLGVYKSLDTLFKYYGISNYTPRKVKKINKLPNAIKVAILDIYKDKKGKKKYFNKIFLKLPDIVVSYISAKDVNIRNLMKYDIFLMAKIASFVFKPYAFKVVLSNSILICLSCSPYNLISAMWLIFKSSDLISFAFTGSINLGDGL
jgi:tetratricopeptide (TPR) repeat protein